jgi:hypothetical protein
MLLLPGQSFSVDARIGSCSGASQMPAAAPTDDLVYAPHCQQKQTSAPVWESVHAEFTA